MKKNILQKYGLTVMISSILLGHMSTVALVVELITRRGPCGIIAKVSGVVFWSMLAIDVYLVAKRRRDLPTVMTMATAIPCIVFIVFTIIDLL